VITQLPRLGNSLICDVVISDCHCYKGVWFVSDVKTRIWIAIVSPWIRKTLSCDWPHNVSFNFYGRSDKKCTRSSRTPDAWLFDLWCVLTERIVNWPSSEICSAGRGSRRECKGHSNPNRLLGRSMLGGSIVRSTTGSFAAIRAKTRRTECIKTSGSRKRRTRRRDESGGRGGKGLIDRP
jgi:hypothetical protein